MKEKQRLLVNSLRVEKEKLQCHTFFVLQQKNGLQKAWIIYQQKNWDDAPGGLALTITTGQDETETSLMPEDITKSWRGRRNFRIDDLNQRCC